MKGKDWAIAGLGLAVGIAAFLMFRKRANAAELLPAGTGPSVETPVVAQVETVLESTPVPPPGRESQTPIELANQPYDGQAAIDAYLRNSRASATRDLSQEQVVITPQAALDTALARAGVSASAPVNLLSQDTADIKKRREAYRGVIRAAATLLEKSGVTGSGCGILDASRALALDPFGVSVDRMAGVVDTVEGKVSRVISDTRKDATFRTISAMTDSGAICLTLVTQLSKATVDVEAANARRTSSPDTVAALIGTKIATALKVSCQAATTPRETVTSSPIIFDAGAAATSANSLTSKTPIKTGFL